jgi:DNA-directed RNA polymerase subunit RPC12/RpoP
MPAKKSPCPSCGSENTRKRFLGIPDVFGFGPGVVGAVLLFGAFIAVGHGFATRPPSGQGRGDWLVSVVVGGAIAVLAILGLVAKSHKCHACGKRFNWPPAFVEKMRVSCPKCGVSLRGVTSDMVGDIGVCPNCKHEFEIMEP